MLNFKTIVAVISVVMTLVGYFYYFKDIFTNKTKPHAYSWLVWGSLTAIAFFGQITDGAGPGAWVTATTALISFVIVAIAFIKNQNVITRSDQLFLAGCAVSIILWLVTNDPFLSIILVTIIDFMGFLPTIRKSIVNPHEETLLHYLLAGGKFALALFALENISVVTTLYPLSLVVANWLFVGFLLIRRRQI